MQGHAAALLSDALFIVGRGKEKRTNGKERFKNERDAK